MLRAHSDSVAVSGTQAGRALLGRWILERKPPVSTHVVAAGLRTEPSELYVINPASGRNLIWVWTLESDLAVETSCVREVQEQSHLTLKGGPHSSNERASLASRS